MSDGFESLVALMLTRNGWWVTTSHKVDLTKDEKVRIGRKTNPRWELDVVAYKGGTNELLIVECKSFLDSRGVVFDHVIRPRSSRPNRYKLFNEQTTRKVVLSRLKKDLIAEGTIGKMPKTSLGLAAGKVATDEDNANLKRWFHSKRWRFFDPDSLRAELVAMAHEGYENEVASFTAKLLIRGSGDISTGRSADDD